MEGFSSNHLLDHSCSSFPYISYYLPQDSPTTTNHCNLGVTGSSSMVYSASTMACGTSKHHDGPSGATNGAIATQASSSTAAASLTSPQHRDGSETSRSRKHAQKRGNGGGGARGSEVEKKKARRNIDGNDDVKAKEACGEPPAAGYIHVRARRGQATDSHSLAERVRREKISERIKMLQSLVPGCDKVTGKALMLDEIINYVQSLQNQVEFLSMKLASMGPMLYEFGVDIDSNYRYFPELLRIASMPHEQLVQCLGQANQTVAHLQHTPFDGTMTMTMTMLNSAQVELATNTADADADADAEIADAPLLPLLQVQGPAAFAQDSSSGGSRVVNMMPPLSQADFDGMCSSFQ